MSVRVFCRNRWITAMRRARFWGLVAEVALPGCSVPQGGGGLEISNAWVRAVPPGAEVSAGYLSIANRTDAADTLTSVESSLARVVEIHRVEVTEEGTMQMRPLEFLAIPSGETVVLKPGGDHLMLIGLNEEPKVDQGVTLELQFRHGGSVEVKTEVRKAENR